MKTLKQFMAEAKQVDENLLSAAATAAAKVLPKAVKLGSTALRYGKQLVKDVVHSDAAKTTVRNQIPRDSSGNVAKYAERFMGPKEVADIRRTGRMLPNPNKPNNAAKNFTGSNSAEGISPGPFGNSSFPSNPQGRTLTRVPTSKINPTKTVKAVHLQQYDITSSSWVPFKEESE